MTGLVATADGWRATVRSIRWSPLLVVPPAASAVLLAAGALGDDAGRAVMVGETGLAFTALSMAFIADDATRAAAPGVPVEAPTRLAARAAVMAPVVALGWLLVLATYAPVLLGPAGIGGLSDRALAALGLASAALALATLVGRWTAAPSPGAVTVAAAVALHVLQVVPKSWLAALPPGRPAWPAVAALAVIVAGLAAREPELS